MGRQEAVITHECWDTKTLLTGRTQTQHRIISSRPSTDSRPATSSLEWRGLKPFEQRVEFEYQNHPSKRQAIPAEGGYEEYPVAFEYQVIDSVHHADAKRGPKYRAAALYGMASPTQSADHSVGEWNNSRLVVQGKHVEHWLNGIKVVDTRLDAAEVRESIEKRWKDAPGIRKLLLDLPVAESPVALQHHEDEAWFRNIKIHRLN